MTSAELAALARTNRLRRQVGCPELTVDARLTEAARRHSADMRDRQYYSHVNPDGDGPADRAARTGYHAQVAENIARGLLDGDGAVITWTILPGPRAKITDCRLTSVGIGVASGRMGAWWTQVLGAK